MIAELSLVFRHCQCPCNTRRRSATGRLFAATAFTWLFGAVTAAAQRPVVLVSASKAEGIACAVVADDTVLHRRSSVYCWGNPSLDYWESDAIWGKGHGPSATPKLIPMPDSILDRGIVSLAVGTTPFVCIVDSSGAVYCWGESDLGALGNSKLNVQRSPVRVPLPEPASSVSAGDNSACALTRSGRVFCWGDNEHGKLGVGDKTDPLHPGAIQTTPPLPVQTTARFLAISAGASGGACGVTTTGSALCWGLMDGQIGLRRAEDDGPQTTPIAPIGIALEKYHSISLGNGFACAIRETNDVRCWGQDNAGQLGSGAAHADLGQRIDCNYPRPIL